MPDKPKSLASALNPLVKALIEAGATETLAYDALEYVRRVAGRRISSKLDALRREGDAQFKVLRADVEALGNRMGFMEERYDERFEQVDRRFKQVDERLKQVDERFKQVDRRFDQVDQRLSRVEELVHKGFDRMNSMFAAQYASHERMIQKMLWLLIVPVVTAILTGSGILIWKQLSE